MSVAAAQRIAAPPTSPQARGVTPQGSASPGQFEGRSYRVYRHGSRPSILSRRMSRFGVYIMGRDYDVDTALTRKQLGWKTKVPYEEAMERIGAWVKEVYSKQ